MTNTELTLNAINNGLVDDGTTSAALDAIREESGCSLLAAVLEVARVYHSARAARDISEANKLLHIAGSIRSTLQQTVAAECPDIPTGAYLTFGVVEGDVWPRGVDTSLFSNGAWVAMAHITVGALWVKREASRLMVEHERRAERRRSRRSR